MTTERAAKALFDLFGPHAVGLAVKFALDANANGRFQDYSRWIDVIDRLHHVQPTLH